jgi:hypothetical protein
VERCDVYQWAKPSTSMKRGPLHLLEVAKDLWEVVSWDLVSPLPDSQGYDTVVVMVNTKTKSIKFEPSCVAVNTDGMAKILSRQVF